MALIEQEQRVAADTPAARQQPTHVDRCDTLENILRPEIASAIWRRGMSVKLQAELDNLDPGSLDDFVHRTSLARLPGDLAKVMEQAGYPDVPVLRADIVMLARRHAAIIGESEVRIRLEVVETDACCKFHADYVTVRTITTYFGRGTQWIEAGSAEGEGLPDGPMINQLSAGDVSVFKGRLRQPAPSVLHRSPPLGESGEQRLVLVIDPVPAEDEAAIGFERSNP